MSANYPRTERATTTMSHTATIDLHVTNIPALKAACTALGLELVENQSTFNYYASARQACVHAIRVHPSIAAETAAAAGRPGCLPKEAGVIKRTDGKPGFMLSVDPWAGGYGLISKIGVNASKLRQRYAAEVAAIEVRKKGFRVTIAEKDGKLVMRGIK